MLLEPDCNWFRTCEQRLLSGISLDVKFTHVPSYKIKVADQSLPGIFKLMAY